ncbi:MAG: caspase family protein [Acidobacteriota bacterium]|nr:caspase family protein [Acidobacteriota bacterium]
MRDWMLLLAVWASAASLLDAQDCTPRALNSIDEAIQVAAASGDLKRTSSLLDEAQQSCPTSAVVARKLADVYRSILLDTKKADDLDKQAQDLDGKNFTQTPPASQQPAGKFVREKWALVVGISKFKNLPDVYQLECPARDAQDFAKALTDPQIGRFRDDGMHVHVVTNAQATLQGLMSEIDYFSSRARAEDLVVLYISSHGTSAASDTSASGNAQTGYIVTYDTNPQALFSTAFAMEDLKKVLDHLKAQRVVVFLDTCFSGDTFRWVDTAKGSKGLTVVSDSAYQRIAQGTGRVLIVSSSGNQESWEGIQNSYFTECLLNAMRQKNGMETVTELFTDLDRQLPYVVQKAKNKTQTPMMWPQGQNIDIVIGTPIE